MRALFQMLIKALDPEEGQVRGALGPIWWSEEARAQGRLQPAWAPEVGGGGLGSGRD